MAQRNKTSPIRRLYEFVALLALIHLVVLVGLAGYLFADGRLNAERVGYLADVLRGELPEQKIATTQPSTITEVPETSELSIARSQIEEEIIRRQFDRQLRELQDKLALAEEYMLKITRRQEALDDKAAAFDESQRALAEERLAAGFRKDLDIISSLSGPMAREILVKRSEAEAVKMIMQMDPRQVKKIVAACKSKSEKDWIARVLGDIQERGIGNTNVTAKKSTP